MNNEQRDEILEDEQVRHSYREQERIKADNSRVIFWILGTAVFSGAMIAYGMDWVVASLVSAVIVSGAVFGVR